MVPVPGGNWDIGDEIEFAEARQQPVWMRWGAAAAAAAVLFIGSYTGLAQYQLAQPVAVVTVDINPSLQLTLNMKDQVLDAKGLNADGELVLKGVDFRRKPLDTVLAAVTDRAVQEQKLNPADETSAVLVGVAPAKEEDLKQAQADRVSEKAKAAVTDEVAKVASAKGQEAKTSVAVLVATHEQKQAAEQMGLSVGKFMLYPAIQNVVPDVTPEEMKTTGPGKLLKQHNVSPSEVFSKAEKKNDQEQEKKSQKEEEKVQPAGATPGGNTNNGNGNNNGKKDNPPGKSDDKAPGQGGKQDDPKQSDKPGVGNEKKQEDKKVEADTKSSPDPKSGKGESKKDEPKQVNPAAPKKDEGKKDSWTIPWLGITIEKPAFLRDKEQEKQAEAEAAPAPSTPRAEEPGAAAPKSEVKEPAQDVGKKQEAEQKQQETPKKQEEQKQETPKKQEEPKQETPKKQEEPKQESPKKQEEVKQETPTKQEETKSNDSKQDEKKQTEKQTDKVENKGDKDKGKDK